MEQKEIRRKNWIDAAKVIAILIVVLNHSGLVIPGVNFWGGMFFVPAFFLLAGYTYSPKDESYKSFVKRKTKRLLLPYFVANALLFAFFTAKDLLAGSFTVQKTVLSLLGVVYGRNQLLTDFTSNVYLMTNLNAPTWFLPALFLVLICADGLYRMMKGNKRKIFAVIAIVSVVMLSYHYLSPVLLPWSLDILPYLLIFFYVGHELKEKQWFEKQAEGSLGKRWTNVAVLLAVLMISGLFNGSYNLSISSFGKSVLTCLIAAITSSMMLMYLMRLAEQKLPAFIGIISRHSKYTLTILCYHYFVMQMFYAAVGTVLPGLWDNLLLTCLIRITGMIVSVLACVIFDLSIKKCTKE